uniref:Uncharacterized protein n=1 Tax=Lotus japonicus TaxID=34305 RepID=I3T432_LOTJA|nr:unknown [Lotus japonicus]
MLTDLILVLSSKCVAICFCLVWICKSSWNVMDQAEKQQCGCT